MTTDQTFRVLASAIGARANCAKSNNAEWHAEWTDRIKTIARNVLPRGSGIDDGRTIDLDRSTAEKIVIHTSFHHMDDGGMYDGWTEHTIVVRGSLVDAFELTISGRDRNQIKDYLYDVFSDALRESLIWDIARSTYVVVRDARPSDQIAAGQ